MTESKPDAPPAEAKSPASAWQPFTPRGLLPFAKATFGRVILLLCTVGLIAAGTIVWFLNIAWFPTFRAAIHELPEQGQIIHQQLETPRTSGRPLAEHRFLGFVVMVSETESDLSSHIAVKFRKREMEICSIFGCCRFNYPKGWTIEFNRVELEPRWGAWEPILTGAVAIVSFFALLLLWIVLGFFYSFIPWMLAWFKHRDLTWAGSWRIGLAAQIPGALLFVLAIWTYGFGLLDVLQFLVLATLNVVSTWVYIGLTFSILAPRPADSRAANPFAGLPSGQAVDPSPPGVEKP